MNDYLAYQIEVKKPPIRASLLFVIAGTFLI